MATKLIPIFAFAAVISIPANAQVNIDFFGRVNNLRGVDLERADNLDDTQFRFDARTDRGVTIQRFDNVADEEFRLRADAPFERSDGVALEAIRGGGVGLASTDLSLPIFFDAFLGDNGGVPADNFNAFFQWAVTVGSVDLVGQQVVDPSGSPLIEFDSRGGPVFGRFVDLGGSTGTPGVFTSRFSFPFLAGVIYNLSFDFVSTDGNPNTATVRIGPQVFTVSTSSPSFTRFSQNFAFVTTTIAPLVFQDAGNDSFGIGIDNIVLSRR
jgi:hypothetical protein